MGQSALNEESVMGLSATGAQMTSETDGLLAVRSALRRCPKCGSESFVDRKVTRSNPASPDASRTELA